MSAEPAQPSPPRPAADRGLLCARCEHLNPATLEKCESCGSHLFIFCGRCNTRNQRVHSRCVKCNRRLHRSVGEWVKSTSEPAAVNFALLGGLFLFLAVAVIMLLRIAHIRLPFFDS